MGKDVGPKNWPSTLPYLLQPSYSPHLTKSQLEALKTRTSDLTDEVPAQLQRGPSAVAKISPITTASHPAYPQAGLFAARNLPARSFILPYYGVIHSSLPPHSAAHESSDYDLWLDRESGVAVDAEKAGNEARFVNDYRGVKERPNAEFREVWDPRRGERCMAVFVLPAGKDARKGDVGIRKGEEILVSYGKGFWGKRKEESWADADAQVAGD
jgi:hypothetical protein